MDNSKASSALILLNIGIISSNTISLMDNDAHIQRLREKHWMGGNHYSERAKVRAIKIIK